MTTVCTILAAALVASISGAAMAGELKTSQGNQTSETKPPPTVAAPAEPPAQMTPSVGLALSVFIKRNCGRDTLLPPTC
jgi:hypothetical protein